MKYLTKDGGSFDTEPCIEELIEVIKKHKVPLAILNAMLKETEREIKDRIIIQ